MRLCAVAFLAIAGMSVLGQPAYLPQGGEYNAAGDIPGDQTNPRAAINSLGGYIVWQDNFTDGDGSLGIAARRLDKNLSGSQSVLHISRTVAGDQENPRVALLKNGGAVFAWQGGKDGFQKIYARFLKADGTFVNANDILVNTYTNSHQINPALAVLKDGSVVVTWSSYGQDGDHYGVYGQRLSATGEKLGTEFAVNQTTANNQRDSSVSALADGRFVVVWINERAAGTAANRNSSGRNSEGSAGVIVLYKVQVYARVYNADGTAATGEFAADSGNYVSANPVVSGAEDGGFLVAWSSRVGSVTNEDTVTVHGWDVFARSFNSAFAPKSAEFTVNAEVRSDQYEPQIAAQGNTHLVVWTSVGQDGSREGIFGRFVSATGVLIGDEFGVNTTTASRQITPTVAADGDSTFLVAWSSFVGGVNSMDLFAQRYSTKVTVPTPDAPYVSALSQSKLSVTWPLLAGYNVAAYQVFVDGSAAPIETTNNSYKAGTFNAGSTHTFKLAYRLADGQLSAQSMSGSGTTWGEDANFDGLPDDWQAKYFGADPTKWPAASADSDGDGASNLQEFLAGTDPTNKSSVLRTKIVPGRPTSRLNWNTVPGAIYQIQGSADGLGWVNIGDQRFAPGDTDSAIVEHIKRVEIYRVIRVR